MPTQAAGMFLIGLFYKKTCCFMKISQKTDFVKSPLGRPDIGIGLRPDRKMHRAINDAYLHYYQLVALAVFCHGIVKISGIQACSKLPGCRPGLKVRKKHFWGGLWSRVPRASCRRHYPG